ncbi:AGAP004201-PA-like protein [Anopheles sinensis]|uniref:AGAP004201-PA-like protein n=1 Tax=Anopheles sinensis TaxID=74873 RepID=A0A084VNR4_ANOSI|nr:AGAP004201-PA-like protein [Anopheles sinensis]
MSQKKAEAIFGASKSTLRLPETNATSGSSGIVSSVSDGHISTNSIISSNLGNGDASRPHESNNGSIEYVFISKVQVQPLHQDDLLYESQADVSDGQRGSQIHRTGAFRSRSSKIWDPHPQYELTAFGNNLHLKLYHDDNFISKDIKVTHFWPNESLRRAEDHVESGMLQRCFYKGVVQGDESSSVRVSLCEGMHGHIVTSNGSFLIEPVQNVSSGEPNVLHRIQRLSAEKSGYGADGRISIDGLGTLAEDCAVRTDHETDISTTAEQHQHSRRKRSASHFANNEHTIEVLVAVDNKMERYHGSELKSYVLTLMGIVSNVYADASIGNSIKIAVVHIMYIHHDLDAQKKSAEKGIEGVSASDMLQDFCRFKQTASNFHHDAALILTREKICRNPAENNCDTLGLAELGTICRPSACAIVQDNGLSASFTIAHELGHVLGMPHDDDNRCSRHRGNSSGNDRIMSRTMDGNTHPWQWSNCSRHILTEYLEKNPDNCLRNHPTENLIDPNEMDSMLAGEKFTNNEQCELVFGNGSKICSYMPVCSRLWCSWEDEVSGCKTQHMPWADGTRCDEGHWCQKGQCVPIDRTVLQPQNGGWGAWSSYGPCSRNCGGGVQNRTRECDSPRPRNGGKFCAGLRVDYRPCNTQPCPDSRYNFREEQCHRHDGQNFDVPNLDPNVRWIPKYGAVAEEQCKLYCRVQDKNLYFMLSEKVIDGTPCTFPEDSFDMCINGQCRKAGCDYVLDSDAKLDQCGVCNGDNTTCRQVSGLLLLGKTKHYKPPYDKDDDAGRKKEFHIPEGATNLNIIHDGYMKDAIYLSLTSGGEVIFNDPKHQTPHTSKHRLFAGVRLEYSTIGNQERITSTFGRPLREKLTVKVNYKSDHYRSTSGQVNYNYLIPIHPPAERIQRLPEPSYQWKMSSWMPCDQQCSGKKRRTAVCYNTATGKDVAPENCNETVKPQDLYEPCNTECKYYWEANQTECSNPCGEGIKQFNYRCMQAYTGSQRPEAVNAELCSGMPKPLNSREPCRGPCKDAVWWYSQWTRCSVTCGEGQQAYVLQCMVRDVVVNAALCGTRPVAVITNCTRPPCEQKVCVTAQHNCANVRCPSWTFGQWSQCNDECIHSRQVLCQDHRGKESDQCAPHLKPLAVDSCCKFRWRYDVNITPSSCDASGRHTPRLICKRLMPKSPDNPRPLKTSRKVDDKYCAKLKKPSPAKEKKKREHCFKPQHFRWEVSPWSKCSVGCGTGRTVRNVTCTDGCKISPKACNATLKPPNTKVCEAYTHCRWRTVKLNRCNCKGKQNRTVKCFDDLLKVESNRCPEHLRPKKFSRCDPPPHCRNTHNSRQPTIFRNCRHAQQRHRTDGEYTVNVNGTGVKIYCHGMATASPAEYLTLAQGPTENYAIYVKRRAADANKCPSVRHDWEDESISYGATHYRKIRINLRTMQVITNDFLFTNSSGKKQPFGSAGDCYSNTGICPQGDFAINLMGTPFRISPHTAWKTSGVNAVLKFLVRLEAPYKKVRARCGGYCGHCFVSPDTHLYLELDKPFRSHGLAHG